MAKPEPKPKPMDKDAENSKKITAFFAPPNRGGRPANKGGGGGRPRAVSAPAPVVRASGAEEAPSKKGAKKDASRTSYKAGENKKKLEAAVAEWKNKSPRCTPETSLRSFAAMVGIPPGTFYNYVTSTEEKARVVGSGVGRASQVDGETQQFLVDALRKYDRGNDGRTRAEGIDMLQELKPELSRKQASNAWSNNIMKNYRKEITGVVKAQATTVKRSAITVEQQYRWHTTFEACLNLLHEKNTGRCRKTGKPFAVLSPHFVIGGDEECLLASDGDVTVIGDKMKKKHEKQEGSRTSITMYRTGSAAGDTGPTAFLPSGTRIATGFTDAFLERHGAAKGSSIVMTPTGFMTDKAWLEVTKKQVEGIRAMPAVCDNPDWWVLKVVDGFGSHVNVPEALQLYWDNRIILLKEEAYSSHVNQAFDKFVSKSDKINMRHVLDLLRRTTAVTKGVVDQWGLIHVGLAAVRACEARTWIASFIACNLNPLHRISFGEWCIKISSFLEGGQSFKDPGPIDKYAMLPPYWHGMIPEEKGKVFRVIEKHGAFSVPCVMELGTECNIPMTEMQHMRLCYEVAKENPVHLTFGLPVAPAARTISSEEAAAAAALKSANHGLRFFNLKPPGIIGLELFEHMSGYARRHSKDSTFEPSAHLDLEMSKKQKEILNPSAQDLTMREIMKDAGGDGAQMKHAKRKLDVLGITVRAHSGIANNPERLKRLKAVHKLAESMAEISRLKNKDRDTKKTQATNSLHDIAPAALLKLRTKLNDATKIHKKEICAIALRYFGSTLADSQKKPKLVEALQALIEENPCTLDDVVFDDEMELEEAENAAANGEDEAADDDEDARPIDLTQRPTSDDGE